MEESKLKFGTHEDNLGTEAVDEERAARLAELPDDYLRSCVDIDASDIQAEFQRIPGDLAYWNMQYATALREYLRAELTRKITWARLEPVTRAAIIEKGGKPTDTQVKSAVEANSDYIAAQEHEVECEVRKNEVYGFLDSIRSKKEMLISLGAQMRAELEGDPLLRETTKAVRGAKNRAG